MDPEKHDNYCLHLVFNSSIYFGRIVLWKNVNAAAVSHLVSVNVAVNKSAVLLAL